MSVPQGRCPGCGERGPVKDIDPWHISRCPDWARLYQGDPAGTLSPAQEFARWSEQDRGPEHAADLQRRVDDTVANRAASRARFASVDLLGEP
jgi:hypothetical protein